MRDLTVDSSAEIAKSEISPIFFVKMGFDSGDLNLWSGYGGLVWNGETYLGAGDIGAIDGIKEVDDIEAVNVTLTINSIPSENISLALTEDYQGRPVTIWLGMMDGTTVIADPLQIFAGRMDIMTIDEGPETSSISVSVESRLVDLLKPRESRYTHEDQQIKYPGDLGLEFVPALQNKELNWVPS